MKRRSNQGFFERLRGPSSRSYRGELQRRRKEARAETMRRKEAEREQLRREREQIREANRLKRKLMAEERLEIAREKKERAKEKARSFPSKAELSQAYKRGAKTLNEALDMLGYSQINPKGKKGDFARCVKAVSERGGAYDPNAVCAAQERKKIGQKELTRRSVVGKKAKRRKSENPADSAVEAYKIFHGREPEELVTIAKDRHYHKHLAAAGELERLDIVTPDGRHKVVLQDFGGSLLCFNEQALPELAKKGKVKLSQLFVEGGDQTVELEDFGIDPDNVHELETLGKGVRIDYFTKKDHLGDEGGVAVYAHKFRTTNEDGKHKTLKIAKYPDVIYRVRDNQLEFSGGSYEIRTEGIDK